MWQIAYINTLNFMFVSDRFFKFFKYQISSLSFIFVTDKSFKLIKYQICVLSFFGIKYILFIKDVNYIFNINLKF
jgi:hypothetical protein